MTLKLKLRYMDYGQNVFVCAGLLDFVWGIHESPLDSAHKGLVMTPLLFSMHGASANCDR